MNEFISVLNVSELSPESEYFVQPKDVGAVDWINFSAIPKGRVERYFTKPKISRYRAALQAVCRLTSAKNQLLISHMPIMTAAVSVISRIFGRDCRHIAFAFNFTSIPSGLKKSYLRMSFRWVDGFVVFSEYERSLYSKVFDIPEDRIHVTLWTQDVPPVKEKYEPAFESKYLCAIGGEGRDFVSLMEAARISGVNLVVVARPRSLKGISVPENVRVFSNLPIDVTWALARRSCGVVIPLLSKETCCGQITVVSAQMLGLPIITNASHALNEYISEGGVSRIYEPGDAISLAENMTDMVGKSSEYIPLAAADSSLFIDKYSRGLWVRCLNGISEKLFH